MTEIEVKELEGGVKSICEVVVKEGLSKTTHRVGVPEDLYQKLTGGKISKADCVKASFRFLLDREPKESILAQFDLPVISRYFPEFEKEFKQYCAG